MTVELTEKVTAELTVELMVVPVLRAALEAVQTGTICPCPVLAS